LLAPSISRFGAHFLLKFLGVKFDEKSRRDVADFHPAVVVAAAPLDVVLVVSRGNYSSRLCESMFVKALLFDALVFVRVPASPVKSCTYFWIQNVKEFV
jgi:hypothetical protein